MLNLNNDLTLREKEELDKAFFSNDDNLFSLYRFKYHFKALKDNFFTQFEKDFMKNLT